jgi:hypothetical protein
MTWAGKMMGAKMPMLRFKCPQSLFFQLSSYLGLGLNDEGKAT